MTNETAPAVAEICVRLDGLPLAIELAAARIRLLPPQAVLTRLSNRLKLLTGGARDLPARQQTLRATIDWSYNLLTPAERTLFARLAVFVGGCTLEAVEAVCNPASDFDVLEGVESLVAQSLLRQEEGSEPHMGMLETVREYAWERLEERGEVEELRERHAAYYLALAEAAEPGMEGLGQVTWLVRLEQGHDNLRAALEWARERGEVEAGLRLVGALWRFWWMRRYLREGQGWLEDLLTRRRETATTMRAKAVHGAGVLALVQGDYERATARYEEALALCRDLGHTWGSAMALNGLAEVARAQGDYGRATALLEESLALCRDLGATHGIAILLDSLGLVAWEQGHYGRAQALLEESLALARELGERRGIAITLSNLGDVARAQGHHGPGTTLLAQALVLFQELNDKPGIAECLARLARVALAQSQPEHATRLCAAVACLCTAIGAPLPPAERATYDAIVAAARAALGEDAFAAAWARGQALPLEQAIAEALGEDVAVQSDPLGACPSRR